MCGGGVRAKKMIPGSEMGKSFPSEFFSTQQRCENRRGVGWRGGAMEVN